MTDVSPPPEHDDQAVSPTEAEPGWPVALRIRPSWVLAAALALVAVTWVAVVLVDVVDAGGVSDRLAQPLWGKLDAFAPLRWVQWYLLAGAAAGAAHLGGRLAATDLGLARFLRWYGAACVLLLVGASEVFRHAPVMHPSGVRGDDGLGAPVTAWLDAGHAGLFAALAVGVLVALGRHLGAAPSARRWAVATYGLLAVTVVGVVARHAGDRFTDAGRAIDRTVLGERLAAEPLIGPDAHHHALIEVVIGHAVLVLGAACALGLVLAVAADARTGRLRSPAARHAAEPAMPRWLRLRPATLLIGAAAGLVVVTAVAVAVDLIEVGGWQPDPALWLYLYNDGPVEWSAWSALVGVLLGAAYLSGRLRAAEPGVAAFFGWLAVGVCLMVVEDIGDVRHYLHALLFQLDLSGALAAPPRSAVDVAYFGAVAAPVVWALVRHGRTVWAIPRCRPFLVAGYGLYGLASVGSALSSVGDLYARVGRAIDETVLGSRLPGASGMPREMVHFLLVDGPLEEPVELIAVLCLLSVVLVAASPGRAPAR